MLRSIPGMCVWLLLFASSAVAMKTNVIVVLDDSGSMNQPMARQNMTRMLAAKRALIQVLEILPDDTHVGIVLLNGRLEGDPWVIPLGPVDMDRVRNLLDKVQAEGETPLGKFLKAGADALLTARRKEHYGSYRLLVVTDGEASDKQKVNRYLPDILARGLTVDVIGVDMAETHSLATRVSSYRQADDPESLTKAITEVFAETSTDANDAGESDFELLDAFPDEVAEAALLALAEGSGNEPIGTLEGERDSDQTRSDQSSRSGSRKKRDKGGVPSIIWVVALIIAWIFVSKLFRIGKSKDR